MAKQLDQRHKVIEARVLQADKMFAAGEISKTWNLISPITSAQNLPKTLAMRLQFLILGCAVYQTGDLEAAKQINAKAPVTQGNLAVRYRLALRQKQHKTAKMLRTSQAAIKDPTFADEFKTSASNYCLWNFRYKSGFRLYRSRHAAKMFTTILPKELRYAELPKNSARDLPRIILEQGAGDVVMYLSQIRQLGGHEKSTFFGIPKYRGLINQWFPQAQFIAFNEIPAEKHGLKCHCAADFLERAWYKKRSFLLAQSHPGTPKRGPLDKPVFGLCWRGGSNQNRREERHIPLQFMLDLLPADAHYLALQVDMTDEERELLACDPRIMVPFINLKSDTYTSLDLVSELAGVIGVDSANWHFAGASDVPILAIMNPTSHWFWGPDAKVESVYPEAKTIPKSDLSKDIINVWIGAAKTIYQKRQQIGFPTPIILKKSIASFERPLFVASVPRSRSSMIMNIFAEHGVWTGKTVGPTTNNPRGFFENYQLRETFLKGTLKQMGADPLGVKKLPRLNPQPPYPELADQIRRLVTSQGYEGGYWGFKDPKITLLWPMFAKAFPKAQWIILRRNLDDVVASLCRTSFMKQHSTSPEYWKVYCKTQQARLDDLQSNVPGTLLIDTDEVVSGTFEKLQTAFEHLELSYSSDLVRRVVEPALLHKSREGFTV